MLRATRHRHLLEDKLPQLARRADSDVDVDALGEGDAAVPLDASGGVICWRLPGGGRGGRVPGGQLPGVGGRLSRVPPVGEAGVGGEEARLSLRAVLIGLALVLLVCGFNDLVANVFKRARHTMF